jgi:aspartate aminotransferase
MVQTVMLAPATGFYSTPGSGTNEVRLAYVLNKEDLKNAILCLKEALKNIQVKQIKTLFSARK